MTSGCSSACKVCSPHSGPRHRSANDVARAHAQQSISHRRLCSAQQVLGGVCGLELTQLLKAEAHQVHLQLAHRRPQTGHHNPFPCCYLLVPGVHLCRQQPRHRGRPFQPWAIRTPSLAILSNGSGPRKDGQQAKADSSKSTTPRL